MHYNQNCDWRGWNIENHLWRPQPRILRIHRSRKFKKQFPLEHFEAVEPPYFNQQAGTRESLFMTLAAIGSESRTMHYKVCQSKRNASESIRGTPQLMNVRDKPKQWTLLNMLLTICRILHEVCPPAVAETFNERKEIWKPLVLCLTASAGLENIFSCSLLTDHSITRRILQWSSSLGQQLLYSE